MILESSTNVSNFPSSFTNANVRRGSRSKSMSKMTPDLSTDDIQPTNNYRMPFSLAQEKPLFGLVRVNLSDDDAYGILIVCIRGDLLK